MKLSRVLLISRKNGDDMRIINKIVSQDIESGKFLKLNLGVGRASNGFYGVDLCQLDGVDIYADLNEKLSLIPDNSVSEIYSRHTFEHIVNLLGLMEEVHRISCDGAKVRIIVPHYSNVYAFSDPTHVRFFGLYSMNYFVSERSQPGKRKVPSYYTQCKFTIDSVRIEFYKNTLLERVLVPFFARFVNANFGSQEFYERRLAAFFHAWQIVYDLRVVGKGRD